MEKSVSELETLANIYQDKYLRAYQFLMPWQECWSNEVLQYYPHSIKIFPTAWIDEIKSLDIHDQWKFDCFHEFEFIKNQELKNFLEESNFLENVDVFDYQSIEKLPPFAYMEMKEKKVHEIDRIAAALSIYKTQIPFTEVIDIGGGVGHLSRTLAQYYEIPSTSIDMNLEHQTIGKKRAQKYIPRNRKIAELKFINFKFGSSLDSDFIEQEKKIFHTDSCVVGLHACGPLTNSILDQAIKYNTKVLSFACCYHKLMPETETNLSQYSKRYPISFNDYSLTLATRGDFKDSYDEFLIKKRVKFYRFAFHLFLTEVVGHKEFVILGNAKIPLYESSFDHYAQEMIERIKNKIPGLEKFTKDDLLHFYHSQKMQQLLETIFAHNLIRFRFSRILELMINYDRILYLIEHGFLVKFNSYFDQEISPRNTAIWASKE